MRFSGVLGPVRLVGASVTAGSHNGPPPLHALDGLPLEIALGRDLTSVTAVLRGGRPGGAVLLRGGMDALPVQEDSGEEFTSRLPGRMHGCGHDLHTAGLVGAARLLADRRESLDGDVVFMFQPGEEGTTSPASYSVPPCWPARR